MTKLRDFRKAHHAYYQAGRRKSPTAGSFIRPSRPVDQPVSFLQALHNKYAADKSESNVQGSSARALEQPIKISGKVVEEVGFEKIRQQLARLYELQIVVLDGLRIAGALSEAAEQNREAWSKEVERIRETCPQITELDISRNLVETWAEVEGVCVALPKLKSLRVKCVRSFCSFYLK